MTAKEVNIGVIADLTGPTAAVQVPFTEGIKTQVEAINKAGGVNGRTIKLLMEDEKYEVPTGLAAYKKLVSQTPALGIIGLNNSSLQVAAIKQVETNKVPVFGAEATTKQAINPFNPYFFAMQCSYADQADVAVPYMAEKTGAAAPKVATLALDVESGYEWGDLIKARVEKAGGEYLGHTAVPPTATEADAQIQKIAKQNPDFIALHGSSNTSTIVLKSMQKFDVKVPVIGIFATGGPAAYASVPAEVGSQFETVNCYTPSSIEAEATAEMLARAKEFGFEKIRGHDRLRQRLRRRPGAHRGAQGRGREPEPRVVQEGPGDAQRPVDRRAVGERDVRRGRPRRHPDGAPVLLRLRDQDVQGGRRVHRLRRRHLQRVPRGHRVGR